MPSPRRRSSRQVNALQAVGLLVAFVVVATTGGLLGAGLLMPAVAATSALTDTSVGMFDELPTELEIPRLAEKSTIVAADGTVLAEFFVQNRIVVPLSAVSKPMIDAVIATEDRRFYEHGAVDLRGMTRALVNNALTDETEGASTLTQQYIKNMLIQAALELEDEAERAQAIADANYAGNDAEGYARKLREARLAIALEQRMTKDQILEGYLNIAQFGLSVYGVETAAQLYFSVPASELSYLQAATIAGITKSPVAYDPQRNPEAAQSRRNLVLGLMLREGTITQAEHDAGVATPIADTLSLGTTKLGCANADGVVAGSAYFCDYVTKIMAQDPVFGETARERRQLLYAGGLTIHTTLDPHKQTIANDVAMATVPPGDPSAVAVALSVVEPGTGKVLALAQSTVYDTNQNPPPGHTAVNYNTPLRFGGSRGFPAGSTFKPFTVLEWLKEGRSLREVVDGTPKTWEQRQFTGSCTGFGGAPWKLRNSEGGGRFMTVLDATKNSVNNAFADMASQVDMCGIFQGAEALGVTKANGEPLGITPAAVIGTNEVAPLSMAAAFAAFSADGIYCDPVAITAIEDREGNPLPVPSANCRQPITPQLAAGVTYSLSQVWSGTASSIRRLPDGRPASGKTGTTSENEHTWFVGYTRQLSTAVWVGHPDGTYSMQGQTINGRTYYRGPYGSSIAAPAWRAFMEPASAGMEVLGFPEVSGSMLRGVQVKVPDLGGMSVDAARRALNEAKLNVIVGSEVFSNRPAGSVASTDPAAGASVVRGTAVTLFISRGPEPVPQTPPPAAPGLGPGGPGGGGGGGGGGFPWPPPGRGDG